MTATDRSPNRPRRLLAAVVGATVLVLSQFAGAWAVSAAPTRTAPGGDQPPVTIGGLVSATPPTSTTTTSIPTLVLPRPSPRPNRSWSRRAPGDL